MPQTLKGYSCALLRAVVLQWDEQMTWSPSQKSPWIEATAALRALGLPNHILWSQRSGSGPGFVIHQVVVPALGQNLCTSQAGVSSAPLQKFIINLNWDRKDMLTLQTSQTLTFGLAQNWRQNPKFYHIPSYSHIFPNMFTMFLLVKSRTIPKSAPLPLCCCYISRLHTAAAREVWPGAMAGHLSNL